MATELRAGETTAKAKAAGRRAYVTLLAGDNDGESLQAVVRLAERLRKVGAAYQLVVAVLPGVPASHRSILVSQYGCVVREIQPVYPPGSEAQFATSMPPHDVVNCSKLRVLELVEYERMVYLDKGIHLIENIDKLFELEKGYFYAAELGPPPAQHFDGGMFVHEPSMATAEALLDALRVTPPTFIPQQDFISMFFKDQCKPIPLDHHLVRAMLLGHPKEQLEEAKHQWTEKLPPLDGRLATKAAAVLRQNLPAMATLVASSAAVGVVTNATNPAICFAFYAVFITAIVAVSVSLGGI